MKTYFKLFSVVVLFVIVSSFTSATSNSNGKVIFTKLYENKSSSPKLYQSITIFSDGKISLDIKEGSNAVELISKKLTKTQFSKFKKLLNKSSLRYLKQSYICDKSNLNTGNFLFSIDLPSVTNKIHVQEGCNMPKMLRELNDFLTTEIIEQL